MNNVGKHKYEGWAFLKTLCLSIGIEFRAKSGPKFNSDRIKHDVFKNAQPSHVDFPTISPLDSTGDLRSPIDSTGDLRSSFDSTGDLRSPLDSTGDLRSPYV